MRNYMIALVLPCNREFRIARDKVFIVILYYVFIAIINSEYIESNIAVSERIHTLDVYIRHATCYWLRDISRVMLSLLSLVFVRREFCPWNQKSISFHDFAVYLVWTEEVSTIDFMCNSYEILLSTSYTFKLHFLSLFCSFE